MSQTPTTIDTSNGETHDFEGVPRGLTYSQMVRDCWKESPGKEGNLMHAVIGLAGEVGEIFVADSRSNLLEELGDMEYYLEKASQLVEYEFEPPRHGIFDVGLIHFDFVVRCAYLLDIVKKSWVYERDLNKEAVAENIFYVRMAMDSYYEILGTTREASRRANMVKLVSKNTGRYRTGQYSNEQAIARADKEGEA